MGWKWSSISPASIACGSSATQREVSARRAGVAGVRRLVQESLAFVYADGGDAWLTEDAPVVGGTTTSSALDAEANAARAASAATPWSCASASSSGRTATSPARTSRRRAAGISPSLGRREAYRPTLWLDDAAAAVGAALAAPPGVYNVADADPPTRAEIDAALAAVVDRDALAAT